MVWARHPHAPWHLGGMSFAESWFFPAPSVGRARMEVALYRYVDRLGWSTVTALVLGFLAYGA